MRKRTINNMHGGLRSSTQQTYVPIPDKPVDDGKDDTKTIIKEVIKKEKDIGAIIGTAVGTLITGIGIGATAYSAYKNKGIGYNNPVPPIPPKPPKSQRRFVEYGPKDWVVDQPVDEKVAANVQPPVIEMQGIAK